MRRHAVDSKDLPHAPKPEQRVQPIMFYLSACVRMIKRSVSPILETYETLDLVVEDASDPVATDSGGFQDSGAGETLVTRPRRRARSALGVRHGTRRERGNYGNNARTKSLSGHVQLLCF